MASGSPAFDNASPASGAQVQFTVVFADPSNATTDVPRAAAAGITITAWLPFDGQPAGETLQLQVQEAAA